MRTVLGVPRRRHSSLPCLLTDTRTRAVSNTAGARSLISLREIGILTDMRGCELDGARMEEYGAVLQNQPVDVSEEFARQVKSLLYRLEGLGVRPAYRLRQDTLEGPRPEAGRLRWCSSRTARRYRTSDSHRVRCEWTGGDRAGDLQHGVHHRQRTVLPPRKWRAAFPAPWTLRHGHGGNGFVLTDDPLESKVEWNVRTFATKSRHDG